MSRTITSVLAALAVAALLAPAAFAQESGREAESIRVAYGDLNRASASGGQTLLRRIEGAARQVCGDRWNYSQFQPHAVSKCRHDTVAAAVGGLRIDTLTLAWNGKQAPSAQLASR
jgi:UrcA family protein